MNNSNLAENSVTPETIARMRIAYQASGQIVVAHHLGVTVYLATITHEGSSIRPQRCSVSERLTVLLGGHVAEILSCRQHNWQVDSPETRDRTARDLLVVTRWVNRFAERRREETLHEATQRAHRILADHWTQADQVMQALYSRGMLTALEIVDIFNALLN